MIDRVDWSYVVLLLFLTVTIVGFYWRRTRIKLLYYVWLGLMWLEVQARKIRDRRGDPRDV